MNQTLIIQRAFNLVRRYRVLWILGILLALTGGGSGGGGNGNASTMGANAPFANMGEPNFAALIGVIVIVIGLLVLLAIVAVVVRYVVQAGLYRSVEEIEDTSQAPSFRQGFRLGWNFRAFRLFVIDLVIGIPATVIVILLLAVAASPLLLLLVDNEGVRIFSVVLTIGLALLMVLLIIIAAALISLFMQFIRRAAVLDDRGVLDAIRQGVAMARRHFGDVAVMWVLMLGIGLAFGLLMIPVFILVGGLALLLAGGPAWLLYQLTGGYAAPLLVGIPIGLLVFIAPLTLIGGFYEAFQSTVWTLTYREVRVMEAQAESG